MKRVKGVVKNNVVVLEEGAHLPEGAKVEVRVRRFGRRQKIKEAVERILANPITHYVGMDEVIEEMKREQNGESPDGKPPAS